MQTRYAGEVSYGQGHRGRSGAVHIRQQAQVERDIVEDGIEDSGPVEDGSGQISALGGTDLHEAWSIMKQIWITSIIIMAVILVANLGGLWLIGAI